MITERTAEMYKHMLNQRPHTGPNASHYKQFFLKANVYALRDIQRFIDSWRPADSDPQYENQLFRFRWLKQVVS